jgi:hypothetical protein
MLSEISRRAKEPIEQAFEPSFLGSIDVEFSGTPLHTTTLARVCLDVAGDACSFGLKASCNRAAQIGEQRLTARGH